MPEAWPITLTTRILLEGYSENWAENVIRSPMDIGPAKVRRRTTAAPYLMTMVQHYTTAHVATFSTFFNTTLASGALSFTITHPRTGGSVEARYTAPPRITPLAGASGYYRVEHPLEILS
jgi:hypothetical protein